MRAAGFLVVAIAGCTLDEAPAQPSWQVDVMPVVAANCVRCHGHPLNGQAPVGMRLDSYENIEVAGLGVVLGAAVNATEMARLTGDSILAPGDFRMPPGRELDRYELRVLRNWAGLVDGSLKAPRGPGRPDNALPVLSLAEVARDGALVTFGYELRDGDDDLVVGTLRTDAGVIGDLVSGRDTIVVDTTGLAPGSHDLVARLDDGADVDGPDGIDDYIEVVAGTLEVP